MPRRDACWPPRCWAGMTSVSGLCPLCRGQRGQAGSRGRGIAGKHVHQPKLRRGDRRLDDPRYLDLPLGLPISADACAAGSAGRRLSELRASRMRGEPFIPPVAVPEQRFVWERVVAEPGAGTFARLAGVGRRAQAVLDGGGRRFPHRLPWMSPTCPPNSPSAPRRRGNRRLRPGGAMDGLAAAIQPDTLAAHFHPMLCAAVNVINVRGLGPLLAALGASAGRRADPCTRPWRWPRRRMTEQRARAAEAIARSRRWPAGSRAVRRADRGASGGRFRLGRAAGADAGRRVIHQRARRLPRAANAGALLPRLVDADGKPMARPPSSSSLPRACPTTMACR